MTLSHPAQLLPHKLSRKLGRSLLIAGLLANTSPGWSAEPLSDTVITALQAKALPELALLLVTGSPHPAQAVELGTLAHQLTITVVNTTIAANNAGDRQTEASRLVAALEWAIRDRAGFEQVAVIHVNYVLRPASGNTGTQRYDFYKSPGGSFVMHTS